MTENLHPLSTNASGDALKKRHRAEFRFRLYGRLAILTSFLFLGFLLFTIVSKGTSAFEETVIKIPVAIPAAQPGDLVDTEQALKDSLIAKFNVAEGPDRLKLYRLLSRRAPILISDAFAENPAIAGTTVEFALPASSNVDMYMKGKIDMTLPDERRMFKDVQMAWVETLKSEGRISMEFNRTFFSRGDSREPENAGFWGSLIGSVFTLIVCLAFAFPLGVGAAIYLEEFAPKNKLTDFIEVNINNLAAVPSIVYGLLGLAVFLHYFGMPRGSAFAGGCTLALLILPTLVITTRNSLKSVPPSIRLAAQGLGASPMQVLFHHTLPLAMPGIMTGTILGIARAMGETAPLLMIGMVAFVASVPATPFDTATTMPVQIYLWSDSPEMGFLERTSAGIMVLLGFLIVCNAVAAFLRKKYEMKW